MAGTTYYLWRRNDGWVGSTCNSLPRDTLQANGEPSTFTEIMHSQNWREIEARYLAEPKPFRQVMGQHIGEITKTIHDAVDGHQSSGIGPKGQVYTFYTNFKHDQLYLYLNAVETLKWDHDMVGVSPMAYGYDEETGQHFEVPEAYALFLNHDKIDRIQRARFNTEMDKIIAILKDRN
jgi:hypothetical protein